MQNTQRPQRTIGTLGLTLSGITCIIGSGWLFGAFNAAKLAGPAAIFSWIIGGFAILLIGLSIVELATLLPQSGGMVRYMHYSHGSLSGFITGWANWISIVTIIPAEATASMQYLSSWHWQWCKELFDTQTDKLTHTGLLGATLLVFIYFLLNYWTVQLFVRFVVSVTIFKIVVPMLTAVLLFAAGFHSANFSAGATAAQGFAPYGWSAVLTAVATCGIVFSFNGFQTPANFAGEAKNPQRAIPLAIIGSIVATLLLYVILQIVFIGALPTQLLANGWHVLQFSSPYAQLALALNLNFLMLLLYADAFISPSVTAIAYMGSTTRMLYGMQKTGFMPEFMGKLHPKYLIPRGALWANLIVGLLFLYTYRGWGSLAAVISVTTVISYVTGPITSMSLRRIAPHLKGAVRLPGMRILAPLTFIIISLVFFWSRWPLTGQVIFVLSAGMFIYFYFQAKEGFKNIGQHVKASVWLIAYMLTMALLSYIGGSEFGGKNIIPEGWDQLVVAIVAFGYYQWGIRSAWVTPALAEVANSPEMQSDHLIVKPAQPVLRPASTLEY